MKKLLIVCATCLSTMLMAQDITVGDTVMVKPETSHYLTGEKISKWVYLEPHQISQVGTAKFPNGILLNIKGANSWLGYEDVYATEKKNDISTKEQETVIIHDTIISYVEKVMVKHDTICLTKEIVRENAEPLSHARFQFYGDANLYVGDLSYGAGLDFIFGARLSKYAFVGAGVEFDYLATGENAAKAMQFPVFVNTKVYLPIQDKYFPYVDMSLGANMGYTTFTPDESLRAKGFYHGLWAKGGIGIDLVKNLSLGIGYQYGGGISSLRSDLHHGYVKIGFTIPE